LWLVVSNQPHYTVFMDIGLIANDYPTSGSWVRAVRTIPHEDE